ncbi:MAG: hypothetical protein Q8P93_02275, partial [bacterium]|nr:hypothetical protein [bacterium]
DAGTLDGYDASDFNFFPGGATTTVLSFTTGLTSYGSTTIGGGTQATGLTVDGGATTTGFLTVQSTATSTFTGDLSVDDLGAASLTVTGSGTSSFTGGLTAAGLASSQGLTISGGRLINTASATSSFTGGISAGGLASSNGLSITGGNVRLTETTTVGTSTLTVSATGDLTITANGGDVRILDEGFSVCDLGGCPSLPNGRTATSTPGSAFVENVLYFPSTGWSVGTSTNPNTPYELTFYDETGEVAVIFDNVE